MRRLPLLVASLLVLPFASCSCDPPGVGSDAGPTDGGVQTTDGGGGAWTISGSVWVQLDDGTLARLNLVTGDVSFPLGRYSVEGGLLGVGDDELLFMEADSVFGRSGRMILRDMSTGDETLGNDSFGVPRTIAFNGTDIALSSGSGGTPYFGPWGAAAALTETNFVGHGVTTDPTGLVVSTADGLRRPGADQPFLNAQPCDAVVYDSGDYVCAAQFGRGVFRIAASDGAETTVDAAMGAGYHAVAVTSLGVVATRDDCALTLPALADTEYLCPGAFAEISGDLYFTSQFGGLFARDDAGGIALVRHGLVGVGGVDETDGRLVLGRADDDRLLVATTTFGSPWFTPQTETPLGVASTSDGAAWVVEAAAVRRAEDGDVDWTVIDTFEGEEAVHAAHAGDTLWAARGSDGLSRLDMSAHPNAATEDVSDGQADLVGGCSDTRAIVFDGAAGLIRIVDDAGERDLLTDLTAFGTIVTLGCVDDQALIGNDAGEIWVRPLDFDDDAVLVGTTSTAPRFLAWSAGS